MNKSKDETNRQKKIACVNVFDKQNGMCLRADAVCRDEFIDIDFTRHPPLLLPY